ncbi:neural cell adhesion molecule 2 [Hoplias malabaricus]|uniref:neural cell adhesion molecule 2 n=1 Tax=Hoplias malabaricus TaxID=27720 RepID=UPI0034617F85
MLQGQGRLIPLLVLLAIASEIDAATVQLGHSAIISCKLSCSEVTWWIKSAPDFQTSTVFQFSEGKCTVAPEFEGRIECSGEKIRSEDVSLNISSVVYNDRGWYYCSCDGKDYCDQKIEVLIPTDFSVSFGAQATLPCFAETEKNSDSSSVYIQWEKDTNLVVKLENGEISYGPGFEQRAMLSTENYKKGDLSLTINNVRFSDSGLFKCSLKDGGFGYPQAVSLTVEAHQFEHYKKEGDSVSLDLLIKTPVTIYFTKNGGKTTDEWVCTNPREDSFHCKPDYEQRASILNNSVMFSKLSESDSGLYTITDIITNEVVGVHKLTVIGSPFTKVPLVSTLIFACAFLIVVGAVIWNCVKSRLKKETKGKKKDVPETEDKHVQFSIQQSENYIRSPIPFLDMKLSEVSPLSQEADTQI